MIEIGPGIVLGPGVKIGGEAYANASGGSVTTTNTLGFTWRVHTFAANGTFTTSTTILPCWVMIVAGGGGGGSGSNFSGSKVAGGGGGAGNGVGQGGANGVVIVRYPLWLI